jgi:hypothetical protein
VHGILGVLREVGSVYQTSWYSYEASMMGCRRTDCASAADEARGLRWHQKATISRAEDPVLIVK